MRLDAFGFGSLIGTLVHVPCEGHGLIVGERYTYQPPNQPDADDQDLCFDTESYDRIRIMFNHGTFEIDCDDVEVISESR